MITVNVPLDLLKGAKDLTPEGISEFLGNAVEAAQKVAQVEARLAQMQSLLATWNKALIDALDNSDNEFQKAQRLRQLVSDTKGFAR